ncbi:hypothetical protein [Pectobacterium carotovorum]|uniref:hypothetical protein n=1 Tax=Pectobacterium carotovorum TaxID=554 RepID=UPI0021C41023|nr:hypothetical protein [Pectobacterium carotovorum]
MKLKKLRCGLFVYSAVEQFTGREMGLSLPDCRPASLYRLLSWFICVDWQG